MRQSSKNRLSALSGFPVKGAMVGLATANREGKPAERQQEVLTPPCIVEVCESLWGKIALDPCWCEGAITNPIHRFEYPKQDGLKDSWIAYSYVNPPYKDLRAWLEYGRAQPDEQIWLVPVRTHRWWWRDWRDYWLSAYCELDPIKFIGYDSYFPAPLLLGYRGRDTHGVREFIEDVEARELGSVYPSYQYLDYK